MSWTEDCMTILTSVATSGPSNRTWVIPVSLCFPSDVTACTSFLAFDFWTQRRALSVKSRNTVPE